MEAYCKVLPIRVYGHLHPSPANFLTGAVHPCPRDMVYISEIWFVSSMMNSPVSPLENYLDGMDGILKNSPGGGSFSSNPF
jgi:hypothetical protein